MLSLGYYSSALSGIYAGNTADFDGSSDSLRKNTQLTGIADSKVGTFSCWIKPEGGDGTQRSLFELYVSEGSGSRVRIYLNTSNKLRVGLYNSITSDICTQISTGTIVAASGWRHICMDWNLAAGATGFDLYIDDALAAMDIDSITNDTINYAAATYAYIGGVADINWLFNGCISDLYFNPTTRIGVATEATRRKFIGPLGEQVNLGSDGSIPTGTAPIVYMKDWNGVNAGTGGNFTVVGSLTACSDTP